MKCQSFKVELNSLSDFLPSQKVIGCMATTLTLTMLKCQFGTLKHCSENKACREVRKKSIVRVLS